MQGLRAKVAEFSRELQDFAQQLATGVDELKRTAKAKPCVGRESSSYLCVHYDLCLIKGCRYLLLGQY